MIAILYNIRYRCAKAFEVMDVEIQFPIIGEERYILMGLAI